MKLMNIRRVAQTVLAVFVLGSGSIALAADPNAGAALYNTNCSGCHGADGAGVMPGMPNFARGEKLLQPDSALLTIIEEGQGVMPAYRGLLSTQQILDVVAYLRTLY